MTENLISEWKKDSAKPVRSKEEKIAAAKKLFSIILKGLDIDPDKIREERLGVSTYMKNSDLLRYKGYSARPEYSADNCIFYGKILEISDLVDFQSESIETLEDEFHKAVDDYLGFCQEIGKNS